jgi:hypothetical protein
VEPESSLSLSQKPATCPYQKELANTNSKERRKRAIDEEPAA